MAPVVDLAAYRKARNDDRAKILQQANRARLARARYARARVWGREIAYPTLFTMRHLNQAVAICRHWGLVDDATLKTAGFKPAKSGTVRLSAVARREAA